MTLPVPLPARVLLLGSGELGKEVTIALKRYGCTVIACDSYPNAPAMQVADESRVVDMSDPEALRDVLDGVDVDLIVPEVEAIATDELSACEDRGVRVVPNAFAVQATMDRQRIRTLAASLPGVRTSAFRFARSEAELATALDEIGYPAFVKPTMSSSGHGQSRVTGPEQAASAWAHAEEDARATTGVVIVEEGVDFDYEITLLTVRSWDAKSGTVTTSFCAPIGHRQEGGDYVESELSPRPHDTGMVTMVTQAQSEFELHARAILGLPVSTAQASPGASAVIKSTGAVDAPVYEGVAEALATADIVRIFGKPISRADRRVGVVAATASTPKEARVIARRAAAGISIDEAPAPCA